MANHIIFDLMEEEIKNYFQLDSAKHPIPKLQCVKGIAEIAEIKVIQSLLCQEIRICEVQKHLTFNSIPLSKPNSDTQLSHIQQNKSKILKQLSDIEKLQAKLKQETTKNKSKLNSISLKKQAVFFSSTEFLKLKQLARAQKSLQRHLEEKYLKEQQKSTQIALEAEVHLHQLEQKNKANRKIQIEKRIKFQQQRKQQKIKKYQQLQAYAKEKNQKQYLYQILKKKWQQQTQNQSAEAQKLFQQSRVKSITLQDIKKHKDQVQAVAAQRFQERQRKLQESQIDLNLGNIYRSQLYYQLLQEKQKEDEQEQHRKIKIKMLNEKKIQYGKLVRDHYLPPIYPQKTENLSQTPKKQLKILTCGDVYLMGKQYMVQARKHLSKKRHSKPSIKENIPQSKEKSQDILARLRLNRQQNALKPINRLQKILNKSQLTRENKLSKAMQIIKKLDSSSKHNDENLVSSIDARLRIIKQLT